MVLLYTKWFPTVLSLPLAQENIDTYCLSTCLIRYTYCFLADGEKVQQQQEDTQKEQLV